ncbi:4Fe-4S dicluster domain-containing protein [Desulfobacula phenolica]|uniref:4Fe-4S dicluster domain-containing protein n=1 Tax=Desulfobacula phenolica TaxID=90732 RepID=A0A1H2HTW5_9BACT|nr:4Fe-4S dicluster domain-containing protein [Desulfobacula phenolica]SDU35350.1 4Fe-4S dicluster domain-containing protein [Desulfobacula phenolica]
MEMISIHKTNLAEAMAKAQETYTLAGPVATLHGYTFRELEKGEPPDFNYTHTYLSPKAVVFPQSELLFHFKGTSMGNIPAGLSQPSINSPSRAAVGIRPYDAKAIRMLAYNFDTTEFQDPYFMNHYKNLTLVGLAENNPDPANFSTSCGTGPFDETYLDILLVDTGDEFTGKILTPKGKTFADTAGFTPADPGMAETINALKHEAEAKIASNPAFLPQKVMENLKTIANLETLDLYNAPIWEDLAFGCINCSTCTFVCPTCWCFDIQDETDGQEGVRIKLWDSCMSDLYSTHASGHNPREKGWQRFRNRFMHKLKYFPDKYGHGVMCVGCGRCISSCPAGIDIRTISQTLNQLEAVK